MKKSKLFAPFLMLLAGAIASIMMFYFHYSSEQMLPRLLAVLLIFYLTGAVIQNRVTSFTDKIREEEQAREREAREREASAESAETAVEMEGNLERGVPERGLENGA